MSSSWTPLPFQLTPVWADPPGQALHCHYIFVRPSATKSGRPCGVMFVSSTFSVFADEYVHAAAYLKLRDINFTAVNEMKSYKGATLSEDFMARTQQAVSPVQNSPAFACATTALVSSVPASRFVSIIAKISRRFVCLLSIPPFFYPLKTHLLIFVLMVFRPSMTVSRIGLMESRLHHCRGGLPPLPG